VTTVACRRFDYGDKWRVVFAADKRTNMHNARVQKLWELDDGALFVAVGVAGNYSAVLQVVKWLNKGGEPEDIPTVDDMEFQVLGVDAAGDIWLASGGMEFFNVEEEMHAIGSGGEYALGAMTAGAVPERAVEIAATYDMHTCSHIDTIEFDIPKEET
jgi:hypothetical protein